MAQLTGQVQITLQPNFLGGENHRFLPANGTIVDLTFLHNALRPNDDDAFVEQFLPARICIRKEMENAFKELIKNGSNTTTVFSGSPGMGKSVLMFLVVLYRVANRRERAVYIRRTDESAELVSMFAMECKEDHVVQ